jgi:aminoglycoside phosphotransferase family enzyme
MIVDDQREVAEFLLTPQAYGAGVGRVDRIDTHASSVFLAGDRAYKLKRAVRYDYLDFSTLERRRTLCHAELALNRRTAPSLYVDVVPVTREADRRLVLGGHGTPVDWLIRMRRFDQDGLFDRMAARNALDLDVMPPLAGAIATLHEGAERRTDCGGCAGMVWVIDGNARGFSEEGAGILDAATCDRVTAAARASLARHAERLEARREGGFVRVCHGDLHLRNIVLIDGRPTLFDAVEFNEQISCIDVLYDLAFLLMDLWRLNLRTHANVVFNAYLELTNQVPALALPLFLSCRSAVRAKTSATAAGLQADAARARELETTAREYLSRAEELLKPPSPRLVGIGGLTGTGKSALARHLAADVGPAPGAVILRSDVIRKSLCGVPATTRLGPEGYTDVVTAQVYRTLVERAVEALQAGHAVIADAVFGRAWPRMAIAGRRHVRARCNKIR